MCTKNNFLVLFWTTAYGFKQLLTVLTGEFTGRQGVPSTQHTVLLTRKRPNGYKKAYQVRKPRFKKFDFSLQSDAKHNIFTILYFNLRKLVVNSFQHFVIEIYKKGYKYMKLQP